LEEIEKIKEILTGKQIIGITKNYDNGNKSSEFIVAFIIPSKKQPGHIVIKIEDHDIKFLKEFKNILIDNFNKSIRGYKNWKKEVLKY
jgi:hypothetical protein